MINKQVEYTKTETNVCINILYSENFRELVKKSEEKFIGTGNPNSEILIIGKEMAIDRSNKGQYELEVTNNRISWQANIENPDTISINTGSCVNPLYLYYGQNTIPDNHVNNGTSPTWINYQKLIDAINGKMKLSPVVDFHEYCFISEFSTATALHSREVDEEERKKSISDRITLWTTDFMKHFPIVIVAAGHYPREYNINLETLFDVSWIKIQEQNIDLSEFKPTYANDDKTIVIQDKEAKNFINVHYNSMTGRILIHTNQFGYTMYNNTLFCIAKIINDLRKNRRR